MSYLRFWRKISLCKQTLQMDLYRSWDSILNVLCGKTFNILYKNHSCRFKKLSLSLCTFIARNFGKDYVHITVNIHILPMIFPHLYLIAKGTIKLPSTLMGDFLASTQKFQLYLRNVFSITYYRIEEKRKWYKLSSIYIMCIKLFF